MDLKAQGKVRHIGVSNFSVSQMQRVQAIHPPVSLQPPYSMIAREVEAEILPFCSEQNIGVICYSPMGKGLLTGAFRLHASPDFQPKIIAAEILDFSPRSWRSILRSSKHSGGLRLDSAGLSRNSASPGFCVALN